MYIRIRIKDSMYTWDEDEPFHPRQVIWTYKKVGDSHGCFSGHQTLSGRLTFREALEVIAKLSESEL